MNNNKNGFLPIKTNLFDRYFIAVVLFVAISLFWMRFLEPISLWGSVIMSVFIGQYIIRKG